MPRDFFVDEGRNLESRVIEAVEVAREVSQLSLTDLQLMTEVLGSEATPEARNALSVAIARSRFHKCAALAAD